MSGHEGGDAEPPPEEEESFARPFLGWAMQAEPEAHADGAHDAHEAHEAFRPYLLTGGRTGGGAAGVGIETVLVRDTGAAAHHVAGSAELARIVAACDAPVAVAEVAARVNLPVGVVQVLAGDLVSAGVLLRSSSTTSLADDVVFIERLIQGVASL